ncbi:restriction endonuclease subunit S [Rhodoferax sp.]|uniref:restriction endonuclease subunit S n=1 Tax=Rhodoferax sp. TaxID=50421 RepID=UPI00374DE4AA
MSPIEWPKVKLADYVDLLSGFPFKSAGFSTAFDDIPLVKGENVHQGFIDWNKAKRWPKNQVAELDKYRLKPGDVVLAMDRPWIEAGLKQACIREHDPSSLLVQRVSRLRGENGLLTDYLRHLIGSSMFTDYIKPIVTGTSVPHISGAQIKGFAFRLPPPPTQRRIASILSAYDDLIENNTRRIAILEEMARRLYEEWFVRFRFPGHEGVPLVESEFGLVPQGWESRSVAELAIIHRGRSYKGTELADTGGLPFINLKCMVRDGGYRASGLKSYTGVFKQTQTVRAGEMVMAITDMTQERRLVAHVGRVSRLDADFGVFSMDLVRVEPRDHMPESYIYAMLRWSGFADQVKQHANGANVLHLLPARIDEYRLICPTSEVAQRFGELVSPMFALCEALEQKNQNLRTTRDLLLPKLISGELDVSTLPEPLAEAA